MKTPSPSNATTASLLFVIALSMAVSPAPRASSQQAQRTVPEFYRSKPGERGHDFVKTEQFVVPVGASVIVKDLLFETADCVITERLGVILREVFNSLEEITEGLLGDTNAARVAEFKKMRFEIQGYSTLPGVRCAAVVLNSLADDGTPTWRLAAKGIVPPTQPTPMTKGQKPHVGIRFLRTQ